jgi:hypothetical protein
VRNSQELKDLKDLRGSNSGKNLVVSPSQRKSRSVHRKTEEFTLAKNTSISGRKESPGKMSGLKNDRILSTDDFLKENFS